MKSKPPGRDLRIGLGRLVEFSAVFTAALLFFLPGIMTLDIGWDEPVYVLAGRAYVEAVASRDFFGSVWAWNHEHPPLAKYIYGYFSLAFGTSLGSPYFGARVASSIMAALAVALTYVFASGAFKSSTGVFSAALLASTPFFYGMSRYVSLDLPVTTLTCATLYAFYKGVEARSVCWVLVSALFFGLSGSAKVSGFVVFLVLLAWLLFRFGGSLPPKLRTANEHVRHLTAALILYPAIGASVFVASWPWLWVDTYDRLVGPDGVLTYAGRFKAWGHEEFFGGGLVWHPPPYYYVYYLLVKTPIPTLLMFLVGLLSVLDMKFRRQSGGAAVLTVLWFAVTLAVQTYQQPYDALRPVLPIFPPMAIISSWGVERTASWVVGAVRSSRPSKFLNRGSVERRPSARSLLTCALFLALLASSLLAIVTTRPLEISYFNELAGDSASILSTFESSFWAEGLGEAVRYVNEFAPPGVSIVVIGETAAFNEFHRSDLHIFDYVPPSELASRNVEYVVFQGFYLQHFVWQNRTAWGRPSSGLDLWEYLQTEGSLVHVVTAGNAPLVWIFRVEH
jgi:4-amino-4-deoxy-L-arabinose transferase-like glycosyltransferase